VSYVTHVWSANHAEFCASRARDRNLSLEAERDLFIAEATAVLANLPTIHLMTSVVMFVGTFETFDTPEVHLQCVIQAHRRAGWDAAARCAHSRSERHWSWSLDFWPVLLRQANVIASWLPPLNSL